MIEVYPGLQHDVYNNDGIIIKLYLKMILLMDITNIKIII